MAFCSQCGSEVSGDEAYCAVCGIALHNPVLEDLSLDETDSADVESAPESVTAESAASPESGVEGSEAGSVDFAESVDEESVAGETKEVHEGSVPEDEFVDISALKGEGDEPSTPATEVEIPDDEFVDVSALKADATEEVKIEAEAPAEVPEDEFVDTSAFSSGEADAPAEAEAAKEIPDDQFVDVSALKADGELTEASAAEDVPQPPMPDVLAGGEGGTGVASGLSPEDGVSEPSGPEEEVSAVVKPVDEIIQTPLASESEEMSADMAPVEEPEAVAAGTEPSGGITAASEEEEEEIAADVEPEEVAAGTEPSGGITAASEEEEEEIAADVEPEPEVEPAPEHGEDFLEDKTLIAMPVPDLSAMTGSGATKPAEPEAVEEETASEQEEADAPEEAQAAEVEHHLDGEDTLDKDEQPVSEQDVPEKSPESDVVADEPVHTAPNIGKGDTAGSKVPKLQPLTEGAVLNGRYEIVRKIGGGGMGAVYLASDKNLGGVLRAVKEMVQSYIEEDQQEKAVADFKRESMLLTSLEHPAIPTIYDYFFDEGAHRFYLVMKYISGGDLAARLRSAPDGKLDEKEVADWGMQIADVLDYLHNRQPPIVYRDLKPANIMLDGNSGKVMLIDFGIARWINKEEKGVTAVGTMGYAPPELFSGNVVPNSDIYSLGSTMFHLLTGADPQNNPLLIFDFEKHPRPRQINPRLSDQIESILMRAVEYNAEKRFGDAASMRDALADHITKIDSGNVTYGVSESPAAVGFSDQSVFCGFCGQKIVATDMFCAFCGAKQPLAQPGVQSQEYIPVKLTAKLLIEGTSQLDYPSFDLAKEENLVGRRDPMSNIFPEVDLSKFDPQTKISRKHARIFRDGESFMLEDLGSSNGTLLIPASQETVRLTPHQAQVLTHGDRIKLGDTMLHFVITA